MKMLKGLKKVIGKNRNLREFHKKVKFVKDIPLSDFFNFQKLLLVKKVYPYTMVSYQRLSNVYDLAELAENNKIDGAFVECGVWKGGCAAVMAFVAEKAKSNRKVWLFDSFEGLPEPTIEDGNMAKDYANNKASGKLKTINECVSSLEDVKEVFFKILKINPRNIAIKKGWFQNTLPIAKNEIGPIFILRLDGDWYESTKCCLDNLYDSVVSGGYIIIDDYGYWEGSRGALDKFFKERKINADITKIDCTGIYFKKA